MITLYVFALWACHVNIVLFFVFCCCCFFFFVFFFFFVVCLFFNLEKKSTYSKHSIFRLTRQVVYQRRYEPQHDKTNKVTVRPVKPQISLGMRTAKTLIRLGGCPGISESSLGAQSLCWFCHVAGHIVPLTCW